MNEDSALLNLVALELRLPHKASFAHLRLSSVNGDPASSAAERAKVPFAPGSSRPELRPSVGILPISSSGQ